jgi:hypothetical protein
LQFNLSIRELRAERHDAILAGCLQAAAANPVGVLDEKQAMPRLAIGCRKHRLCQSNVGANNAAWKQVRKRKRVLDSNLRVYEVVRHGLRD